MPDFINGCNAEGIDLIGLLADVNTIKTNFVAIKNDILSFISHLLDERTEIAPLFADLVDANSQNDFFRLGKDLGSLIKITLIE